MVQTLGKTSNYINNMVKLPFSFSRNFPFETYNHIFWGVPFIGSFQGATHEIIWAMPHSHCGTLDVVSSPVQRKESTTFWWDVLLGVSKIVGPQIINFNRVSHYKPSILGYHYFLETP